MVVEIIKAIIFGIVEGITEWLPISSTGHLILVEQFLKFKEVSPEFVSSGYTIWSNISSSGFIF